jgi:hypothetical protein
MSSMKKNLKKCMMYLMYEALPSILHPREGEGIVSIQGA